MHIDRVKLAKAKHASLIRLAKALGLHGCACEDPLCRQDIEEKVARALDLQSMKRHQCNKNNGGAYLEMATLQPRLQITPEFWW